jgi:hypothetical protein
LKAAARASGALQVPPSPSKEVIAAEKADCSESEGIQSNPELSVTTDENTGGVPLPQTEDEEDGINVEEDPASTSTAKAGEKVTMPECPPKTFNRSRHISKGSLQFFSPCGAKIASFEMIKSESMTILFNALTKIIPRLAPALRQIREERGMNENNLQVWNAATKKIGMGVARSLPFDTTCVI